jgi:hypothetical protein
MKKRKAPRRNPVAAAVRKIRPQVIPNKRAKLRARAEAREQ